MIERLFAGLIDHARTVISAVLVMAVVAAISLVDLGSGQLRLGVDPSLERLLPDDDAGQIAFRRLNETFGNTDRLLLAVRLPTVLSAEGLATVEAVTQALEAVPGVSDVLSLATAPNLLADAQTLDVSTFTEMARQEPSRIPGMAGQIERNPLYAGSLVTADDRLAAFLIGLDDPDAEAFRQRNLAQALRQAAQVPGVAEVWLTGSVVVQAATTDALLHTLAFTLPAIFLVIIGLLGLAFRCLRATLIAAFTIGLALLFTLALMALLRMPVNLVTSIVPPLVLTLGLSYAVHVLAEFFTPHPAPSGQRLLRVLQRVSLPLGLCGATTAAGFLALSLSPLPAVKQFAGLAAFGVVIAILLMVLFLPLALNLARCSPRAQGPALARFHGLADRLAAFDLRHRGLIIGVSVGAMLVAGFFATRIQSGADYIGNFDERAEVRRDFETLNEAFGGATMVSILIETYVNDALTQPELLRQIDELQHWLRGQPEVGAAVSYIDHLKVLNQSLNEGDPAWFRIPDSAAAVKQILVFGGSESLRRAVDAGFRSAVISVRLNVDDSATIADFVRRVDQRLARLQRPLEASLTGTPVIATRTVEVLASGQWQSIGVALLAILMMLSVLFNSVRAAALALLPNLAPIVIYFGLLGFTGISLNPTTSLIACIVLGIAVDDTIHFLTRFNHDARTTGSESKAVASALRHTVRPVTLTSVALILGFLVFTGSELRSQAQFGWLSAVTLLVAWVVDLTLTPALGSKLRIVSYWDLLRIDLGQSPQHTIPLFSGLSLRQTRLFALTARMEKLDADDLLIREGDVARDMYVVVDGRLEAWIDRDGRRRVLNQVTRGAVVGETGYFGQRRTAHVAAVTPARVLRFNSDDLERLRTRYPRIAATVFRNLNRIQAERIARMTAMMK